MCHFLSIPVRGHTHMTSAKFWDFCTPSPLVRKFTQPPLLSCITLSAFGPTPPPPSVRTSYVYVPKVYDTNATAMQEFTNYGSSLEYRCSLGKQFRQSPQSKATQESYNISCDWEGAWQPSSQIWDCVCKFIFPWLVCMCKYPEHQCV